MKYFILVIVSIKNVSASKLQTVLYYAMQCFFLASWTLHVTNCSSCVCVNLAVVICSQFSVAIEYMIVPYTVHSGVLIAEYNHYEDQFWLVNAM